MYGNLCALVEVRSLVCTFTRLRPPYTIPMARNVFTCVLNLSFGKFVKMPPLPSYRRDLSVLTLPFDQLTPTTRSPSLSRET